MLSIRPELVKLLWQKRSEVPVDEEIIPKRRGRPIKNGPLPCAVCPYETRDLNDLAEHTKIHADKTLFSCPHCPLIFSQKGNLQAHIRTHTKERPFACLYCPFSAAQRGNLVVHLRKHTKEKPYSCHECDYTTAQVANLRSHQLRKHGQVDAKKIIFQVNMFRCLHCKFISRIESNVRDHCKTRHMDLVRRNQSSAVSDQLIIDVDSGSSTDNFKYVSSPKHH